MQNTYIKKQKIISILIIFKYLQNKHLDIFNLFFIIAASSFHRNIFPADEK